VQGLRKELGLDFVDRVRLHVGGSERAVRVARASQELFVSESLASAVSFGDQASVAAGAEARPFTLEGEEVSIALVKDG
jgi:hypothetical protein